MREPGLGGIAVLVTAGSHLRAGVFTAELWSAVAAPARRRPARLLADPRRTRPLTGLRTCGRSPPTSNPTEAQRGDKNDQRHCTHDRGASAVRRRCRGKVARQGQRLLSRQASLIRYFRRFEPAARADHYEPKILPRHQLTCRQASPPPVRRSSGPFPPVPLCGQRPYRRVLLRTVYGRNGTCLMNTNACLPSRTGCANRGQSSIAW